MKIYSGIDPGNKGAVAVQNPSDDEPMIYAMQTIKTKGREIIDRVWLADLFRELKSTGDLFVTVEKQSTRPKQSAQSGLKTGVGYGIILGILTALKIPYQEVTPQAWKKRMLAGTTKDKGAAIMVCKSLFPGVCLRPSDKCRVDNDGMAEALLVSEDGRRRGL